MVFPGFQVEMGRVWDSSESWHSSLEEGDKKRHVGRSAFVEHDVGEAGRSSWIGFSFVPPTTSEFALGWRGEKEILHVEKAEMVAVTFALVCWFGFPRFGSELSIATDHFFSVVNHSMKPVWLHFFSSSSGSAVDFLVAPFSSVDSPWEKKKETWPAIKKNKNPIRRAERGWKNDTWTKKKETSGRGGSTAAFPRRRGRPFKKTPSNDVEQALATLRSVAHHRL